MTGLPLCLQSKKPALAAARKESLAPDRTREMVEAVMGVLGENQVPGSQPQSRVINTPSERI